MIRSGGGLRTAFYLIAYYSYVHNETLYKVINVKHKSYDTLYINLVLIIIKKELIYIFLMFQIADHRYKKG